MIALELEAAGAGEAGGSSSPARVIARGPATVLAAGTTVAAVLVALSLLDLGGLRALWDNLHWTMGAAAGAVAVAWSIRGTRGQIRTVRSACTVAMLLWFAANAIWALLAASGSASIPSIADAFVIAIVGPGLVVLVTTVRGRLSRADEIAVYLDSALAFLLIGTVLIHVTGPAATELPSAGRLIAFAHPILFIGLAVAGTVGLLAVRYPLAPRGAPALLLGMSLIGLAYLGWLPATIGRTDAGGLPAVLFTAGTLGAAFGAATWDDGRVQTGRYLPAAALAGRAAGPVLAGLLFVFLLVPNEPAVDLVVDAAVFVGGVLVVVRQALIVRERTEMLATVTELTRSNRRLVGELRHELEERIRHEDHTIRAERADAIETLSSNVGHEVNNPLTGVLGYAELLLAELPTHDPARADVEKIRDEALRARRIVAALREFAGPRPVRLAPTDLHAVLERAVERARGAIAADAGPVIDLRCQPAGPILADGDELAAVLDHVLANAILATDGRGPVRITEERSTEPTGELVTISIADDGIGMDERTLRSALDPLFSAWPEAWGGQHSGLGLSISGGLIASHGGKISLDSTPGRGTTVSIRLPVTGPPVPSGSDQGIGGS